MRHRGLPARPARPTRPGLVPALAVTCVVSLLVGGTATALSLTAATAADAPIATASPLPTITVAPAPSPSAAPTASPSATASAPAKRLTLEELHAEVARVDADLEQRTQALEDGRRKLAESKQRLVVVTAAATTARAEADRAHVDLGRYAAAAYRGQQMSPVVTVLMGPPADATDTMRNLQNLEQASEIKTDITTYAAAAAASAESLEQEAATLTATNAAAAATLETQQTEARALADSTQKQLVAEVERIAAEKLKAVAKSCLKKAVLAAQYPNGLIPQEALCSTGIGSYLLRGDAAIAFKKLAVAYEADLGKPICLTSAYRDRALQSRLYAADTVMVAVPGRSHHGLGLATDLCGGIESFGTEEHEWMKENAAEYGFFHPDWAEPGGVTPEPWHWEFKVDSYPSNDGSGMLATATATPSPEGT